ncbi:neuropeptide Y receptor type 4-2-like [Ambystoma mexicanum]|uniref:neuropeptide Y receptor type 4-2-like n=1 Tax=Ambystoma mexicanum TaxID=8296 RepID=UPI0037E84602
MNSTSLAMLYKSHTFNLSARFQHQCENSTDITSFLSTSYSLLTIIGLLGNLSLICVIARQKEKSNVTNTLIANLSFSDIIVCIFCLPATVVSIILKHWLFGEGLCKLTNFLQCTSVTVSSLSLVLIALERHQLIINPTGWKPNIAQAYTAIALVWIVASLLSLPFITFSILNTETHRKLSFADKSFAGKATCMESWPSEQHQLIYAMFMLVFQYCGPLSFIFICYLRIYLRLQRRKDMFERSEYNSRMAHIKRVNVMLASMVAAFAVCWLPFYIFNTVYDWNHEAIAVCQHDLIFSLCHLLAMMSTCINPIIYGFLNSNFKKEVKSLIQNCKWSSAASIECEHYPLSTMQSEVSKGSMKT